MTAKEYTCPRCKRLLAKRDARIKHGPALKLRPGTTHFANHGQVPGLRCPCGHRLLVLVVDV